MLTVMFRRRSGTPLKIVGRTLSTVTRAVVGSTLIVARVTTVPRLNGPAVAGTAIESPYGAPLYGPVRNTGPANWNGVEPDPAVTAATPILLASAQVPALASASPHSATAGIAADRPSGSIVLTFCRYCWPSARPSTNVKFVWPPAFAAWLAVACVSENGSGDGHAPPLPLLSTVNGAIAGENGLVPENGTRLACVVAVPHVSGLAI